MGRDTQHLATAYAGNVIGITGIDDVVFKFSTLATLPSLPPLRPLVFQSSPIVQVVVEPEDISQAKALERALALLDVIDPNIQVGFTEQGESFIAASGELHVDRCLRDLKDTLLPGVELKVHPPSVAFKETIIEADSSTSNTNAGDAAAAPAAAAAVGGEEDEATAGTGKKKKSKTGAGGSGGVLRFTTANACCSFRLRLLPLPGPVTALLESNAVLLRGLRAKSERNRASHRRRLIALLARAQRAAAAADDVVSGGGSAAEAAAAADAVAAGVGAHSNAHHDGNDDNEEEDDEDEGAAVKGVAALTEEETAFFNKLVRTFKTASTANATHSSASASAGSAAAATEPAATATEQASAAAAAAAAAEAVAAQATIVTVSIDDLLGALSAPIPSARRLIDSGEIVNYICAFGPKGYGSNVLVNKAAGLAYGAALTAVNHISLSTTATAAHTAAAATAAGASASEPRAAASATAAATEMSQWVRAAAWLDAASVHGVATQVYDAETGEPARAPLIVPCAVPAHNRHSHSDAATTSAVVADLTVTPAQLSALEASVRYLRLADHAVAQGFQLATAAGPICNEPMTGTCYVLEQAEVTPWDTANWGADPSGPLQGQVLNAVRDACTVAFEAKPRRLVEAMFSATMECTDQNLGGIFSVLSKRRGRAVEETQIIEGTSFYTIKAVLPVQASFGFASDVRKQTGGVTNPLLVFSHWETVAADPYYTPVTEDEIEEFGVDGDKSRNIARDLVLQIRKRKGLLVDEVVVAAPEKQRTLARKK